MSISRKERRKAARSLGLLKNKGDINSFRERVRRSNNFGNQMHILHLERMRNQELTAASSSEAISEESEILGLANFSNQSLENMKFDFQNTDYLTNYEISASASEPELEKK
jgi:hypothetical protein